MHFLSKRPFTVHLSFPFCFVVVHSSERLYCLIDCFLLLVARSYWFFWLCNCLKDPTYRLRLRLRLHSFVFATAGEMQTQTQTIQKFEFVCIGVCIFAYIFVRKCFKQYFRMFLSTLNISLSNDINFVEKY